MTKLTAIGILNLMIEDDIVTCISFADSLTNVPHTPFGIEVFDQIDAYLRGATTSFDFKYTLEGTDFQQKVWQAVAQIPYGETASYKEIATAIGNPNASRAVGLANNKNPIPLVVPCHRVIGTNGKLVGYAGGLEAKRYLLEVEGRGII